MDTAKRLKELRNAKNLTTTELAKLCNISQAVISKLENNNRTADVPTLLILCNTLGVSLSEFFKEGNTSYCIPIELEELVNNAKNLSPEQLRSLNQFIKTIK